MPLPGSSTQGRFARQQRAVDAGAVEAVIRALQHNLFNEQIQQFGIKALANICGGSDKNRHRRQQAVRAGAMDAILAAMALHSSCMVMHWGIDALLSICCDAESIQLAASKGAVSKILAAMQRHQDCERAQKSGLVFLLRFCSVAGANGVDARTLAVNAGALKVVVSSMGQHRGDQFVQTWGSGTIVSICSGMRYDSVVRRQRAVPAQHSGAPLSVFWLLGSIKT